MFTVPTDIYARMIEWRRDFHRYPEVGWTEFRTATKIAEYLSHLNISLKLGKEVIHDPRMGVPDEETLSKSFKRAQQETANSPLLTHFEGGYTGVVATIKGQLPGPTIAFRFDIDALPIVEATTATHQPAIHHFNAQHEGEMHACGHDGHTAIGLALATVLQTQQQYLHGTIKIIFQPAEEGVRGAKSMVAAGVVDDVDYFIGMHIGTGVEDGTVVAGADGFLATTKIDVTYEGVAAHAGAYPEQGRNALVAAAQAVIALQGISRHSEGASRINIGTLQAGSGRNVIADHAMMEIETRGANEQINQYMREEALRIIEHIAHMYDVSYHTSIVGEAYPANSSDTLVHIIATSATREPTVKRVITRDTFAAGSEDATYFMRAVQQRGGQASYAVFGTTLAVGHHHEAFDFDETVMALALHVLLNTVEEIYVVEGVLNDE